MPKFNLNETRRPQQPKLNPSTNQRLFSQITERFKDCITN